MRLIAVDQCELRWPIEPRGAARAASTLRSALIVGVCSDTGDTGLGEAAPLAGTSIDTLDDARRAAADLAARLPLELSTPRHASAIADRTTAAPAARFALETALLVAYAQHMRTSVARLLAPLPHAELRVATVVDTRDEALAAVRAGARCLKLKVGGEPERDIARVRDLARAAPQVPLRLDANRRWHAGDVPGILAALRDLPIEYVEEPCADSHELLELDVPLRLALDESLVTLDRDQLARALASPRLAALVLKPTLLGGFARCLELAQLASQHGVAPVVTHTLEGPVGTAACIELARAIGADVPVGLAPHPALDRFVEAAA